jgi:hypothetical protein
MAETAFWGQERPRTACSRSQPPDMPKQLGFRQRRQDKRRDALG